MKTTFLILALLLAQDGTNKKHSGTNVTAGIQTSYEDNRGAAITALQAGDLEKAADLYQRNIDLGKAQKPPSQFEIAEASSDLARVRQSQRRFDEAEELYQQSIKAYESDPKPNEDVIALNYQGLAMIYLAKSEYAKAEPMFQQSLLLHTKERDKAPSPQMKQFIGVNIERDLFGLASARFQAGDPLGASEYCDKAIKAADESVISKREMIQIFTNCAEVKRTAGKKEDAAELYKRRELMRDSQ